MNKSIHVLLLEDRATDAQLLIRELQRTGFTPTWKRVQTEPEFLAEIENLPDVILADYAMPQFSGLRAADLLQQSGLNIPFILISGTVGEEVAVEAMQHGATDYLLKDRIGRLGFSVQRALEQKRVRKERDQAEEALLKSGLLQKAIFNSANFSCIATDAKGVIQIFNVGAERMLGYTAAEAMNKITPADLHDRQEVLDRAAALSIEFATPIAPGFDALVFKAARGIEDIVDDHATNRKLLRLQLEGEGHVVVEAGDGIEALAVLERESVEAAISDILMPNLDGFGLCLAVRKHERLSALPFILYTSTYTSASDMELARTVGANRYLTKPAPLPALIAALRDIALQSRLPAPAAEVVLLTQYNVALLRKLEDKESTLQQTMQQLERANVRIAELKRTPAERMELSQVSFGQNPLAPPS